MFLNFPNVRRHIKTEHENTDRLNCEKCNKSWSCHGYETRLNLSKIEVLSFSFTCDQKPADRSGLINELFKPGVAGKDVLQSLLLMCNRVKHECVIPDFMQLTNITSIYKNRGSKSDLSSDRGVFNVSAVRSVIDKLVYTDIYDLADSNMIDSNIEGKEGEKNTGQFVYHLWSDKSCVERRH